jgi:hypothetical protein
VERRKSGDRPGAHHGPAISASFNDKDGKPFVFQMGGRDWKEAMTALGFYTELQARGLDDLGVAVSSEAQRGAMLQTLNALFATDSRDKVHGSPWQFSETPAHIGIAPELGEHNVPILTRLGYTEAQIQELKEKHVI